MAGGCGGPALYLGPHLFLRGRLGYRPGRMLGRAGMWLSSGCLDVGQCVTRVMPGQPRPDTGASTGRRGGCGRPALHALVSDLWTQDDGTRNSRAAQDGPVHFQSLNTGVSMRRAVVTAPGMCHPV